MLESVVSQSPVKVISNHGFGKVVENPETGQKSFIATKSVKQGELLSKFASGGESTTPTYLTVQVGVGRHIKLNPEFLQYINHGCDPNVFFDTTSFELRALKNIKASEELTFFYPSTEWQMDQPFDCYCGSPLCLGSIRGAKFIPADIIKRYTLTDFIRGELKKNK
jgi:hypothetical protein